MGIYLNPRNALFQKAVRSEIYVDKTMMLAELNKILDTNDNFVCISRPRRFGKTMTASMITAYYSKGCDSRGLFSNLKIAHDSSFEENLNRFNVIHIDINNFYMNLKPENRSCLFDKITVAVNKELSQAFQTVGIDTGSDSLGNAILKVWAETEETFILLFDEYDVLVREKVPQGLFDSYLDFLSSLFKNSTLRPAISLAYLTGILPIVRDPRPYAPALVVQSKMNEFFEYSMVDSEPFSQFVGFTEEETKGLCQKYDMDFDECKRWYDGYMLGNETDIYSPRSVVTAMKKHAYGDYWVTTGSYEALKLYILMDFEGIKDDVVTMIGGGRVRVNVLKYMNTMTDFNSKDDVFTYLIHLGYLAYDRFEKTCYIPNSEIRTQWTSSIEDSPEYKTIISIVNKSRELLDMTIACDEKAVAAALDEAHQNATNPLTYNNEASFQSAIGLAYFYATAKYTVIKELPTGRGYADVAFIPYVPNVPAIIVELKNNKTAVGAINQIKGKYYDAILHHYTGDMLFVGINYDEKTKAHECKIERFVK